MHSQLFYYNLNMHLINDIKEIVFDVRKESNPCSLCAKMRKGALNDEIKRLGCNKVAYAHHKDDVIEIAYTNNQSELDYLSGILKEALPNAVSIAVFDTAFHQTMPPKAFMFGLPYEDYENLHVRKYGFHGTSHRFVSKKCIDLHS